jgi:hypothetical protein
LAITHPELRTALDAYRAEQTQAARNMALPITGSAS